MKNIAKNKKRSIKRVSKKVSMAVMGLAALGIVGVSGLGASALSNNDNSQDGLASRLADKFGLTKDDVSSEIDSYHKERHQLRESEMESRVSEALQKKVDEGVISADQKSAVENKLKEKHEALEAEREALKSSETKPSRSEMKDRIEENRNEMKAWLEEQGINLDLKDIMPERGEGREHGGPRMEGGN